MPKTVLDNLPDAGEIVLKRTEEAYQGRVFSLYRETIGLPSGRNTTLDVIKHPGAAAIVPFYDDHTILLLYQYRHAIRQYLWEIPAGTLESGEAHEICAWRELAEETGFQAHQYRHLGVFTPVPGYSNECIQLYTAHNLYPARQDLDTDEVLEVHQLPFETALEMIQRGEIHDGKTICGLLMAKAKLAI